MTPSVQPCGPGELDAVMAIMDDAFEPRFGEAWNRAQLAGMLGLPGVSLLLALVADEPAGFSLSRVTADEAELLLLAVAPPRRRTGVARALLAAVIGHARLDGARRLHLEMRDGNPAGQLYFGSGFAMVGRRPGYYRGENGSSYDAVSLAHDMAE